MLGISKETTPDPEERSSLLSVSLFTKVMDEEAIWQFEIVEAKRDDTSNDSINFTPPPQAQQRVAATKVDVSDFPHNEGSVSYWWRVHV